MGRPPAGVEAGRKASGARSEAPRTLLVHLTATHLLVSLGALALLALLSPYFFRTYYARAELRRVNAAVTGLAHVAANLVTDGAPSPSLHILVRNSASVLGAQVVLVRISDGQVLSTSGPHAASAGGNNLELVRPVANDVLMMVRLPLSGLNYMMDAISLATAATAGLAILLALALALAASRSISAPLVAMSNAAAHVAAEDFTVRVEERGPREIASLARSLNRMAGDLQTAFDEMHRLDELRREFVGNASHELRAPLTNIRGFLDAVLDGTAASPEDERRCLETASAEARRMTRIVEELLQLSRMQAGVLEFDFSPVDLREIACHVLDSFEPRLSARQLTAAMDAQEVPVVTGDGDKIAQVLVNLLDNALRYSPDCGKLLVTLRAEREGVRVAVADQGPGIPDANLNDIWERFHKVDPARPRSQPGAGLGLAIAKEIIKRHGGEVFATNRVEGGAEVGFWVPVGQV
ncbi:MAG: sensor histidine kinase [Armatimonadota bacterium]